MRKPGKGRSPRILFECGGQSTVEYAIVLGAFLAMVVALAAIARAVGSGVVANEAVEAASHSAGETFLGTLQDALLY